jgi:hypothetical protein
MRNDVFSKMNDGNHDVITITNNQFFYHNKGIVFNDETELNDIVTAHFMDNVYNEIELYKITYNNHYDFVKYGVIIDNTGDRDLILTCDKEYIGALKASLTDLGFEITKPKIKELK